MIKRTIEIECTADEFKSILALSPTIRAQRVQYVYKHCLWEYNASGEYWETECGHTFEFFAGNPHDNMFVFCPYCGSHLDVNDKCGIPAWLCEICASKKSINFKHSCMPR